MTKTLRELNKELETAKTNITRLESEIKRKRLEELEPEHAFAEFMHNMFCHGNHTDGCSWLYEGDDWKGFSHDRWLKLSNQVLLEAKKVREVK